MDEDYRSFGTWVKRRRNALDLTQAELAEQVGVYVGIIRKWEKGELPPSKETAERLAKQLKVPKEYHKIFVAFARNSGEVPFHPTDRLFISQAAAHDQEDAPFPQQPVVIPPADDPLGVIVANGGSEGQHHHSGIRTVDGTSALISDRRNAADDPLDAAVTNSEPEEQRQNHPEVRTPDGTSSAVSDSPNAAIRSTINWKQLRHSILRLSHRQKGSLLLILGAALVTSLVTYVLLSTSSNKSASTDVASPFRLEDHVLDARWFNNLGFLPEGRPNAPGSGEAALRGPITLEDGRMYPRGLFTHPKYGSDGFIRGEFDVPSVRKGQHLFAKIGFEPNINTNGVTVRVTFDNDVLYEDIKTLTNTLTTIDIDMSRYDGQSGVLAIEVGANKDSGQDWFWWIDPQIDYPGR